MPFAVAAAAAALLDDEASRRRLFDEYVEVAAAELAVEDTSGWTI